MITILLLTLMVILAFIAGIVIWKYCGGTEEKFDEKGYRSLMDAKTARDDLDQKMSERIKQMNRKTRNALEEDLGSYEFKRLLRG